MKPVARIAAAAALSLIAVSGTADAARKSKELLQYIPADTPYVMAFTKPLPDDLLDKIEPAVDETLGAYRRMIEFMLADAKAKASEGLAAEDDDAPMSDEEFRRFEAVLTEFLDMLSVQGLRDAGIGRDALFAIYGDGLLPVIRIALTDGERFDGLIARFESRAEASLKVACNLPQHWPGLPIPALAPPKRYMTTSCRAGWGMAPPPKYPQTWQRRL